LGRNSGGRLTREQFERALKRALLEIALRDSTHPIMGRNLYPRE